MSGPEPLVAIEGVSHYFGTGTLRKQILFDLSAEVLAGEIVILTGPSGSGKTTLLTLIGGLRSTQEGSLRVLGAELRGASQATLVQVRRGIGYVFQHHNLLDALTVTQNVLTSLRESGLARAEAERRALDTLRAVGMDEHAQRFPDRLSGGQKQRVGIARALVGRPRIVLADEPTASLDKQSGRDVVGLIHDLAKKQGCAVLLVTHDNRILDIADRILHMDEGRISGFADAVAADTQHLLGTLARSKRKSEVLGRVPDMPTEEFMRFLDSVTAEARQLLQAVTISTDDAFESMLEQVLEAFTLKVGRIVDAERATLFMADEVRGEMWSKVAQHDAEKPVEIRIPLGAGLVGEVFRTGVPLNVDDAYGHPLFNRDVDQATGFRTRNALTMPLFDRSRRPFAVMQLLNKRGGGSFDDHDARALREFASSIGVILESWHHTTRTRRAAVA